jgi:hypothetical protein
VEATTTIKAAAEGPTRTFALDLDRVPEAVTVNAVPATVTKDGDRTAWRPPACRCGSRDERGDWGDRGDRGDRGERHAGDRGGR